MSKNAAKQVPVAASLGVTVDLNAHWRLAQPIILGRQLRLAPPTPEILTALETFAERPSLCLLKTLSWLFIERALADPDHDKSTFQARLRNSVPFTVVSIVIMLHASQCPSGDLCTGGLDPERELHKACMKAFERASAVVPEGAVEYLATRGNVVERASSAVCSNLNTLHVLSIAAPVLSYTWLNELKSEEGQSDVVRLLAMIGKLHAESCESRSAVCTEKQLSVQLNK